MTTAAHAGRAELGQSLGLDAKDVRAVVKHVRGGFPFGAIEQFQKSSGLPADAIADLVRIPARTLARRKAAGRLSPDESERLLRLSTLFAKAVALFEGDVGAARQWLAGPKKALGGESPLEFARTEIGAREVEALIGRLEHGVFT